MESWYRKAGGGIWVRVGELGAGAESSLSLRTVERLRSATGVLWTFLMFPGMGP